MIFASFINGIAALCLTGGMAPDSITSASQWCQVQQQQHFPGYSYSSLEKAIVKNHTENTAKSASAPSRWYSTWESAWNVARDQGRPLVCVFVHRGCPECDKLNATLKKPAAAKSLSSAVKLKLEFSRNPSLVRRWKIKYTPTFLVFSPAHNGEVYREVGALSLDRLRTLKPSIDGLVTQPKKSGKSDRESSSAAPETKTGNEQAAQRKVASL